MAPAARYRIYDHFTHSADARAPWALLSERERLGNGRAIAAALHGHAAFMRRLALDATLAGHDGCVNHLRWNSNGTLLASGSDDTRLVVWDYATKQQRERIDTGHRLNIFAVCFVPETSDHILATGAMDKEVRIHYAPFRREATKKFRLHTGRVKDIASSQGVPKVFWSVGEDGIVYQFDVRALPRIDGTHSGEGNGDDAASGVLIRLGKTRTGGTLRGMAMASHPLDPTKVVIACGDFYSRMYDRRMLRTQALRIRRHSDGSIVRATTSVDATVPVEIFAPPHLHMDAMSDATMRHRHDDSHGTSIQFSSDGSEVLANYHNDHIYLFRSHHRESRSTEDVTSPTTVFDKSLVSGKAQEVMPDWLYAAAMDQSIVPPRTAGRLTRNDLQMLYSRGLVFLMAKNYNASLEVFNELCSARATLQTMSDSFRKDVYHSMAKAYLGRSWRADDYLSSQYAKLAESLDPSDREVQLTLLRALQRGRRSRHLVHRARQYKVDFPAHSHDVDEMLNEVSSRRAAQSERQLRVFRQPHDDSGGIDDDNFDDEQGGDDEASHSDHSVDETRSSESSDSGVHVEVEPLQPDSEEGTDAEADEGVASDRDAKFWQSSLLHGKRVNCDVARRFIGYCNLQTDIKEANFFGPNDECIVAGSDDGKAYIWHKNTGKLLNAIDADADIVNCVQPHPFDTCLATSGIENVIRLWKPTSDGSKTPSDDELEGFIESNQTTMADSASYHFSGTNPNIIRLIFNTANNEGIQECPTS